MKFRQLIEYNMINTLLAKNHSQNVGEKLFSDRFLKKKLNISLNQKSKVLYSLFSLYARLRAIEILKLNCRPLASTLCKAF